jgi:hypothetical protein
VAWRADAASRQLRHGQPGWCSEEARWVVCDAIHVFSFFSNFSSSIIDVLDMYFCDYWYILVILDVLL